MPACTPQVRVDKFSKEIARIVRMPAIDKGMRELNLVPIGGTPQEFDTVLRNDLAKWTRVVHELGLKIE